MGKPIISVTNGVSVGKVEDIMINADTGQVAALVTSKGGLLKRGRGMELIRTDDVQVWGRDAVLVRQPEVVVNQGEVTDGSKWLSVSDEIKGRDVISVDGTRIGQLNDLVLNIHGEVVAYDLSQVFVEGPVADSRRIPAEATRAFGQDVLLVDRMETEPIQFEEMQPDEQEDEVPIEEQIQEGHT
jgi:uncharacterized protein YrrD